MPNRYIQALVWGALFLLAGLPAVSTTTDVENHKVIDGVSIYFGVMPAESALAYPNGRVERTMHGGVPHRSHRDHLVVALFNRATGERINDATVTATVSELGLSGETKRLEPMKIAHTVTYGNYFDMAGGRVYGIRLHIRCPEMRHAVDTKLVYRGTHR